MITKAFRYIFYWLYTWQLHLWGRSNSPEATVLMGMSMSFMALIGSLIVIFQISTGTIIFEGELSFIEVAIGAFIVLLIHYLFFSYNGKLNRIMLEFRGESSKQRRLKGFFVLLYTFGSIALFIFCTVYGAYINSK